MIACVTLLPEVVLVLTQFHTQPRMRNSIPIPYETHSKWTTNYRHCDVGQIIAVDPHRTAFKFGSIYCQVRNLITGKLLCVSWQEKCELPRFRYRRHTHTNSKWTLVKESTQPLPYMPPITWTTKRELIYATTTTTTTTTATTIIKDQRDSNRKEDYTKKGGGGTMNRLRVPSKLCQSDLCTVCM